MSGKKMEKIYEVLNQLSYEELVELNRRIVEKLNIMQKVKQLSAMSNFSIGDSAYFVEQGSKTSGKVVRLNRKTVGFETDTGKYYNISPSLLVKIIDK